jgi:hypothetical protein
MPDNNNNNDVFEIAIRKVRLRGFGIDDTIEVNTINDFDINIEQQLSFSIPDEHVTLFLVTKFFMKSTEKIVAHAIVQNTFAVKGLHKMQNKENPEVMNIPDDILTTILSISISHSRALMGSALMGSKFEDFYIPIVNPKEVMIQLFKTNNK